MAILSVLTFMIFSSAESCYEAFVQPDSKISCEITASFYQGAIFVDQKVNGTVGSGVTFSNDDEPFQVKFEVFSKDYVVDEANRYRKAKMTIEFAYTEETKTFITFDQPQSYCQFQMGSHETATDAAYNDGHFVSCEVRK